VDGIQRLFARHLAPEDARIRAPRSIGMLTGQEDDREPRKAP
jgi:hypothetical protein